MLFLAGGTGLAPFLSMLDKIGRTAGSEQPIHLIFGVTNDADLVEVDELEGYAAAAARTSPSPAASPPRTAAIRNKGYVTHHVEPEHLNDGDVDIYLCGPPPMVDAVRDWLRDQGVTPANFYYEKFSPSDAVSAVMSHRRRPMSHPDVSPARSMVVTGAAQGIGRDRRAARSPARARGVVLVDRSELVDEVGDEIAAGGAEALAVTADLETYAGADSAMARGAGALRPDRHPDQQRRRHDLGQALRAIRREAQIEAEIRRSLFPTLWCCRAVLPLMLEQGRGVIVNVSSVATRGVNRVPYAAAKGGVNALTASLALEYAEHGIRVVGDGARRHRGAAAARAAQPRRRSDRARRRPGTRDRRPDDRRPA